MSGLIELENVSKIYSQGGQTVRALENISVSIKKGEFVAVTGASGSGKTTLMNTLGCLDIADSGSYRLDGEEVFRLNDNELSVIRNKKIGFIFQGFNLIGGLTALENVELPLIYRGVPVAERRRLSEQALEKVALSHRANHRPCELSGGQQQRVAIARALASEPPIILADEPTGNLDSDMGREVMRMLRALNRIGKTIVIITHDGAIASQAERTIKIRDGKICG